VAGYVFLHRLSICNKVMCLSVHYFLRLTHLLCYLPVVRTPDMTVSSRFFVGSGLLFFVSAIQWATALTDKFPTQDLRNSITSLIIVAHPN
jgi:hypothetical protein